MRGSTRAKPTIEAAKTRPPPASTRLPRRSAITSGSDEPVDRPLATASANNRGSPGAESNRSVSTTSGAQQALAADPDDVAGDPGVGVLAQPGDGLGDVDRQPALLQRAEPPAELAGGPRDLGGQFRL